MPHPSTIVIVGASLAGAKAAEGARLAGHDGPIVLIGDERGLPYERPPLSKAILRGEADVSSALVHDDAFYADNAIELLHASATRLDLERQVVHLASGDAVAFGALVLATGAAPRPLPGAGAGVRYLRTVDDAVALRDALGGGRRVAVVGAGWIGSEVAASARQVGAEVVLIDPAPTPLHRVVGDEVGKLFLALHADHGVELRFGVGVSRIDHADGTARVVLADGGIEEVDVVVAGVGATPRTEIAAAAGLVLDDGVAVDDRLRSSAPAVFAAGDVASAWHPRYGRRVRVEHWASAIDQGLTAGANAAGRDDVYDRVPYFFSDQYDLGLEYVGLAEPDDEVVVRGDLDQRKLIAFWHRDGVVTAAMNVNVWDVVDDLRALVDADHRVEPSLLADAAVPLANLAVPWPAA